MRPHAWLKFQERCVMEPLCGVGLRQTRPPPSRHGVRSIREDPLRAVAVDDVKLAVLVEVTNVPGTQPPILQHLGDKLRLLPVAWHYMRRAHLHLSGSPGGRVEPSGFRIAICKPALPGRLTDARPERAARRVPAHTWLLTPLLYQLLVPPRPAAHRYAQPEPGL